MNESAPGLRERKMAETSTQLKMTARRLTAERGLAGFTIEELCDEVGVSRRTFFNYFASKERAVMGVPDRIEEADLEEAFVAASGGVPSDTLIDDLAQLFVDRWRRMDLRSEEIPSLTAAIEREPKLLSHLLELASENEREDIALVERREGLESGDLRAAAAIQIFGAILRASAQEAFAPTNTDPFPTILLRRLAAVRAVLGN